MPGKFGLTSWARSLGLISKRRDYELTFHGEVSVRYRRWHATVEDARSEAHRVLTRLPDAVSHPAIIYDADGKGTPVFHL